MRIVIDFQGAQTGSRFRGIGRYCNALVQGMLRNAGEHDIWLVLNGTLDQTLAPIRAAFDGLIDPARVRVFQIPEPVAEIDPRDGPRCRAAEMLREHFIDALRPDVVLVTSLFEGYLDNAVASVGTFVDGHASAVILYDLIPFLNPERYLGSAQQHASYQRKIASLRRAGLLLAISDYARQEAIDALGIDPHAVVAVSTAVDPSFAPGPPAPLEALAQWGISRDMLMYAPGGFDARKNIDGLITAYSLLPAALRQTHQLVIASKLGTLDRKALLAHAARCRLAPDELVLTGYVSDDMLIALYRTATLFIFPSLHEGFGLPALEAMACGALVIGANNTSIPEVISCPEALFDASSPHAIAAKIAEVLGDAPLRARLRAHEQAHVKQFSWDLTAQRVLRALEAQVAHLAHLARLPATGLAPARRRLAVVCPWPPAPGSSAADAAGLLPELLHYVEIDLIAAHDAGPPAPPGISLRSAAWFLEHGAQYDQLLYCFGNSEAHAFLPALLAAHPGVVLLHEFALERALAGPAQAHAAALYRAHGYPALLGEAPHPHWPCNLAQLEQASAVLAFDPAMAEQARAWYGADAATDWRLLPGPGSACAERARALAKALDAVYAAAPRQRPALLRALARVEGLAQQAHCLAQIAQCLASVPEPMAQRQLLVDISAVAGGDPAAGAAVAGLLLALLRTPLPGWRVEPVMLSPSGGGWHYRYAHRACAQLLGRQAALDGALPADPVADLRQGDVLLGAAWVPAALQGAGADGLYDYWRGLGVRVGFLIDTMPADEAAHAALLCAAANADRLLCRSEALRQPLQAWLARHHDGARAVTALPADGAALLAALGSA